MMEKRTYSCKLFHDLSCIRTHTHMHMGERTKGERMKGGKINWWWGMILKMLILFLFLYYDICWQCPRQLGCTSRGANDPCPPLSAQFLPPFILPSILPTPPLYFSLPQYTLDTEAFCFFLKHHSYKPLTVSELADALSKYSDGISWTSFRSLNPLYRGSWKIRRGRALISLSSFFSFPDSNF